MHANRLGPIPGPGSTFKHQNNESDDGFIDKDQDDGFIDKDHVTNVYIDIVGGEFKYMGEYLDGYSGIYSGTIELYTDGKLINITNIHSEPFGIHESTLIKNVALDKKSEIIIKSDGYLTKKIKISPKSSDIKYNSLLNEECLSINEFIVLEPNNMTEIRGRLVDSNGYPISSTQIRFWEDGGILYGDSMFTITDDDGYFTFEGVLVPEGEYCFGVNGDYIGSYFMSDGNSIVVSIN